MKMNNDFLIQYDEHGYLKELKHRLDQWQMNWVSGSIPWGTIQAPEGIHTHCQRTVTDDNTFVEEYVFSNETAFPIYFKENDLGVVLSLPDNYTSAEECMKKHCNVHLWCGGDAAWIQAMRMGGAPSHLGMVLRKGNLAGYSVLRNKESLSNDRGSFLLHPGVESLFPGEQYQLRFEWFWFETEWEFRRKRWETGDFPVVELERSTWFVGETAEFMVSEKHPIQSFQVTGEHGQTVETKVEKQENGYGIRCRCLLEQPGEHSFQVEVNGKRTWVLLYGCMDLERLTEHRCRFIASNQQEKKDVLAGAYLIYDQETKRRYYSHLDDHNGGRERIAMGTLLALWLQEHSDKMLEESLEHYIAYVYRELFNQENGDTCNDITYHLEWDRLYNYPWMAAFLMEVYEWKQDVSYLVDAYRTLCRFYQKDGAAFYPIGLPVSEMISKLEKEKLCEQAQELKTYLIHHGEKILQNGLSFPKSEVNYEQSIVAPAVSVLLQAYEQTKRKDFLDMAQTMIQVLLLFNGQQPDYHLFENAIRHWDGYWFGKRRLLGDTFPHYWSVLTGVELIRYEQITLDRQYQNRGKNSLLGCLNLFQESGFASCAFVYPQSVNGEKAHYYDPWANDQDWALYYAWKYRDVLNA